VLWSLVIVLALAALLMTRSRAGIGFGLLAFGVAAMTLVWEAGSRRARWLIAIVASSAVLLAAYVGLTPILERFAVDELALGYEGRAKLAAATFRAGLDFFPVGSGLGTFADAFRRYQDAGLPGYVDHAHNDYAEAFLELGVAGAVVVVLLAIGYAWRWKAVAQGRHSRTLGELPLCAGLGMAAVAAHGLVDFNFHIPANALYFALLAGLFLHGEGSATPAADPARAAAAPPPAEGGRRRARRTPPR
jgi:O-antigen ligase